MNRKPIACFVVLILTLALFGFTTVASAASYPNDLILINSVTGNMVRLLNQHPENWEADLSFNRVRFFLQDKCAFTGTGTADDFMSDKPVKRATLIFSPEVGKGACLPPGAFAPNRSYLEIQVPSATAMSRGLDYLLREKLGEVAWEIIYNKWKDPTWNK